MTGLQERILQLENSFNTNTRVFHQSIQMLEILGAVTRKVVQDVATGAVRWVPGEEWGDSNNLRPAVEVNGVRHEALVDFDSYLKEHLDELTAQEAKKEEAPPEALLVSPDEDSPIVFGGDGP